MNAGKEGLFMGMRMIMNKKDNCIIIGNIPCSDCTIIHFDCEGEVHGRVKNTM